MYAQSVGGGGGVGGEAALGSGSSPSLAAFNYIADGMGIGQIIYSPDGKIHVLEQIGGQEWNLIDKVKSAAEAYNALNPSDPDETPKTFTSLLSVDVGGGIAAAAAPPAAAEPFRSRIPAASKPTLRSRKASSRRAWAEAAETGARRRPPTALR